MVTAATSFSRNGVADWIVQRFTAVLLAAYTFFIIGYLLLNPSLEYDQWLGLFDQLWVRIFSIATLVSIAAHGWIGLWGVLTDYMTTRMIGSPALGLRIVALSIYAIINIVFVVWGFEILWG